MHNFNKHLIVISFISRIWIENLVFCFLKWNLILSVRFEVLEDIKEKLRRSFMPYQKRNFRGALASGKFTVNTIWVLMKHFVEN